MTLTAAQKATFKANVLSVLGSTGLDNLDLIVTTYNADASPAFWVWKTSVSRDALLNDVSPDATSFNYVGNGFVLRTASEILAFESMFDKDGNTNPSRANVRAGFAAIFSGTGNAAANVTHLQAMARRLSKRYERLFTTGTGSTASPGLLGVGGDGKSIEGTLTSSDLVGINTW